MGLLKKKKEKMLDEAFEASSGDARSLRESAEAATTNLQKYRSQTMKDYNIMVEYKLLKEYAPKGVYLMPSFDDLRFFYGVIFVELGLYRNGIFKFHVELPPEYPADGARPKVTFFSKVFHPLIHPTTFVLDMEQKFPIWQAGAHHLASVLKYVKAIFYMKDFDVKKPLNLQAGQLYARNRESFVKRVETCVTASIQRQYVNEPGSTLKFSEPNAQHEILRNKLLSKSSTNNQKHDSA